MSWSHLILWAVGSIVAGSALDTFIAWVIRKWRSRVLEWRQ